MHNRNTVKLSYNCTNNIQPIIKKHNSKILNINNNTSLHIHVTVDIGRKCLKISFVIQANVGQIWYI